MFVTIIFLWKVMMRMNWSICLQRNRKSFFNLSHLLLWKWVRKKKKKWTRRPVQFEKEERESCNREKALKKNREKEERKSVLEICELHAPRREKVCVANSAPACNSHISNTDFLSSFSLFFYSFLSVTTFSLFFLKLYWSSGLFLLLLSDPLST